MNAYSSLSICADWRQENLQLTRESTGTTGAMRTFPYDSMDLPQAALDKLEEGNYSDDDGLGPQLADLHFGFHLTFTRKFERDSRDCQESVPSVRKPDKMDSDIHCSTSLPDCI